jgi:hypothetical protein
MTYQKIRDSYHARIWLTGEAIAFLDSQFPSDEPEIAIAKLIDREMGKHKRNSFNAPQRASKLEIVELKPQVKPEVITPVAPVTVDRPEDNPINRLQEFCQGEGEALPEYSFTTCREGFSCEVAVLDCVASGNARTKKAAKKDAAVAMLDLLGMGDRVSA